MLYRVKKPWVHSGSSLPVGVETRFVNLQTGAEGVDHEEVVLLDEEDLVRCAAPGEKRRPTPLDLQLAAEAALAYAMALRGHLKDLRDVATAWVFLVTQAHGLGSSWLGRRSHVARAMTSVFGDDAVTAIEAREKSDEIVSVASETWSRLRRPAKGRRD